MIQNTFLFRCLKTSVQVVSQHGRVVINKKLQCPLDRKSLVIFTGLIIIRKGRNHLYFAVVLAVLNVQRMDRIGIDLHLMTESVPYCAFLHLEQISHFCTFLMSRARLSGSDFMIWSNSANLPGLKNTLVRPNLKSLSLRPKALNKAWK